MIAWKRGPALPDSQLRKPHVLTLHLAKQTFVSTWTSTGLPTAGHWRDINGDLDSGGKGTEG